MSDRVCYRFSGAKFGTWTRRSQFRARMGLD